MAATVEVLMTLYRGRQAKLYFFVLISRTINHLSMVHRGGAMYQLWDINLGTHPQDQDARRTALVDVHRKSSERILKIEIDLIGYARYHIPYNDHHVTDKV